jgi:hypothetical protein
MSLVRALGCIVALWAGIAASTATVTSADAQSCRPREECCKVCDLGKACGNSCISERYNCHKGRGCACNVEELCPDGS